MAHPGRRLADGSPGSQLGIQCPAGRGRFSGERGSRASLPPGKSRPESAGRRPAAARPMLQSALGVARGRTAKSKIFSIEKRALPSVPASILPPRRAAAMECFPSVIPPNRDRPAILNDQSSILNSPSVLGSISGIAAKTRKGRNRKPLCVPCIALSRKNPFSLQPLAFAFAAARPCGGYFTRLAPLNKLGSVGGASRREAFHGASYLVAYKSGNRKPPRPDAA